MRLSCHRRVDVVELYSTVLKIDKIELLPELSLFQMNPDMIGVKYFCLGTISVWTNGVWDRKKIWDEDSNCNITTLFE
jgi:hypothetical protein